jgi:hypothetical protein
VKNKKRTDRMTQAVQNRSERPGSQRPHIGRKRIHTGLSNVKIEMTSKLRHLSKQDPSYSGNGTRKRRQITRDRSQEQTYTSFDNTRTNNVHSLCSGDNQVLVRKLHVGLGQGRSDVRNQQITGGTKKGGERMRRR